MSYVALALTIAMWPLSTTHAQEAATCPHDDPVSCAQWELEQEACGRALAAHRRSAASRRGHTVEPVARRCVSGQVATVPSVDDWAWIEHDGVEPSEGAEPVWLSAQGSFRTDFTSSIFVPTIVLALASDAGQDDTLHHAGFVAFELAPSALDGLGNGATTIAAGYGMGSLTEGGRFDLRLRYATPTAQIVDRAFVRLIATTSGADAIWLASRQGWGGLDATVTLRTRETSRDAEQRRTFAVDVEGQIVGGWVEAGNGLAPISGMLFSGEISLQFMWPGAGLRFDLGMSGTSVFPDEAVLPVWIRASADLRCAFGPFRCVDDIPAGSPLLFQLRPMVQVTLIPLEIAAGSLPVLVFGLDAEIRTAWR